MTHRHTSVGSLLLVLVLAACGGGEGPKSTSGAGKSKPVANTAGQQQARQLFESLCFTCHGLTGHGDGPGAGALNPKPRSFVDEAWQASVTDEQIKKTIVFGGAAVGKSPMMPAQPQLKGQEGVLDALVAIVRGFQKKA